MRVLFVTPYVPTPKRGRSYNFIRSLAGVGHQITLVAVSQDTAANDNAAKQKLAKYCEAVHVVPFSVVKAVWESGWRVATPVPVRIAYYGAAPVDRLLRKLSLQRFDVAHCMHLPSAQFARPLHGKMPVFLDAVHCTTQQQEELVSQTAWYAFGRAIMVGDAVKLKRYEPKTAALFERVLLSSDRDAAYLAHLGKLQNLTLPIKVLPNGLNLEYYAPQPTRVILPGNIVYLCKANDAASQDAALRFCEEIFPAIRQSYPFATFTVVGAVSLPKLEMLAKQSGSGIELVGPVRDIRPYLARAALAVCPMQSGEEMPYKLQEMLAMGKAVVSTPLAAHIMDTAAPGESFCVADTPLSFATQIMYLLNHSEEVERLGKNARRYAEENCDWTAIARRMTQLYEKALRRRAGAAQSAAASD